MELLAVPAGFADLIHRFVACHGNIAFPHDSVGAVGPLMRLFDFDGNFIGSQSLEVA